MNRRFYCAVGVASGVILLGGGVAQAAVTADEAGRDIEPTAMRGLPTDIYTPTGEQQRLAASIGTLADLASNKAPGQAHAEIQANTESLRGSQLTNNAVAGRAELLPNIGAGSAGADGLLGGLLGGLPGGSLLGKIATDGPLGQLLGNGPLGGLLGAKKAPADNSSPSGAATANPAKPQAPATRGNDVATDVRQARPAGERPASERPAGERPAGATGTRMTDPALSGPAANPASPLPALNQPTQPGAYQVDGAAAVRGNVVQGEPAPSAGYDGEGYEEKAGLLGGSMLGPNGPLGSMQLLGGEALAGLPLVGELLAGGLSLDKLSNLSGIAGAQDGDKAPQPIAGLATVGKLSKALLGPESTSVPAIDKKKVTPQLQPLFGHDALDTQGWTA